MNKILARLASACPRLQLEKDTPAAEFALLAEDSIGSLDRLRFSLVVLLEFRAEVGHVFLRVLEAAHLTGGLDSLLAGISRPLRVGNTATPL